MRAPYFFRFPSTLASGNDFYSVQRWSETPAAECAGTNAPKSVLHVIILASLILRTNAHAHDEKSNPSRNYHISSSLVRGNREDHLGQGYRLPTL